MASVRISDWNHQCASVRLVSGIIRWRLLISDRESSLWRLLISDWESSVCVVRLVDWDSSYDVC